METNVKYLVIETVYYIYEKNVYEVLINDKKLILFHFNFLTIL